MTRSKLFWIMDRCEGPITFEVDKGVVLLKAKKVPLVDQDGKRIFDPDHAHSKSMPGSNTYQVDDVDFATAIRIDHYRWKESYYHKLASRNNEIAKEESLLEKYRRWQLEWQGLRLAQRQKDAYDKAIKEKEGEHGKDADRSA